MNSKEKFYINLVALINHSIPNQRGAKSKLAEQIGVSRQGLKNYLTLKSKIPVFEFLKILDILEIDYIRIKELLKNYESSTTIDKKNVVITDNHAEIDI